MKARGQAHATPAESAAHTFGTGSSGAVFHPCRDLCCSTVV